MGEASVLSSQLARANCRIIVVRARNPNNIGGVARAMKNFGITDLVLVGTHPPVWSEARSAVGARDLLAKARAVATLADAVADRTLVAGTTAGTRHPHETELISPAEFAEEVMQSGAEARVAILFGSEKTGLTKEELSHCHLVVRIPTEPECPSMNLAQAVAVCCYELTRSNVSSGSRRFRSRGPASAGSIELLLNEAAPVLKAAGFFRSPGAQSKIAKLRRTLLRLGLSEQEATFFLGAIRQIRRQVEQQKFSSK